MAVRLLTLFVVSAIFAGFALVAPASATSDNATDSATSDNATSDNATESAISANAVHNFDVKEAAKTLLHICNKILQIVKKKKGTKLHDIRDYAKDVANLTSALIESGVNDTDQLLAALLNASSEFFAHTDPLINNTQSISDHSELEAQFENLLKAISGARHFIKGLTKGKVWEETTNKKQDVPPFEISCCTCGCHPRVISCGIRLRVCSCTCDQ